MVALTQRFSRGMRPDCGEYFDKDTWVGHVYPDRDDKRSDELVGTYRTLAACRLASLKMIQEKRWQNADYECGLNCRREDSGLFRNINICKETLR